MEGQFLKEGAEKAGEFFLHKLKKRSQFQKVYTQGRFFKQNDIILGVLENRLQFNRIGVSIDTKSVRLSVRRNRTKRLILEACRLYNKNLKQGYEIVIIAKRDLSRCKMQSVYNDIVYLFQKAGLVK